ncbi:MAG: Na+/H+ antiporter subunit E, partial [Thermosipho sp. (in: Bacteria)]|nr:Na+/H+ antiporter subunit E [Thermosipho sp. (in: thermotogales)]
MSFSVFIVTFFTWLLLTSFTDVKEILVGFFASLVVSVVMKRYYGIRFDLKFP